MPRLRRPLRHYDLDVGLKRRLGVLSDFYQAVSLCFMGNMRYHVRRTSSTHLERQWQTFEGAAVKVSKRTQPSFRIVLMRL